ADRTSGCARHGSGDSVVARPDHRPRAELPRWRSHRGRGRRVRRRPLEGSHRRLEALARRARCFRPRFGDRLMPERTVQIANRNGLHARPAAEIVKLAAKFQSEITIVKDDLDVNGKSIMGVMMLAAEHGSSIILRAEGPDADQALEALANLVSNKFGESCVVLKLVGLPAPPGIASGPVHPLRWEIPEVTHRIISDDAIPAEIERLHEAFERAKERLSQLRDRVERT